MLLKKPREKKRKSGQVHIMYDLQAAKSLDMRRSPYTKSDTKSQH